MKHCMFLKSLNWCCVERTCFRISYSGSSSSKVSKAVRSSFNSIQTFNWVHNLQTFSFHHGNTLLQKVLFSWSWPANTYRCKQRSNMDERVKYRWKSCSFSAQKKFFLPLHLGEECIFFITFLWKKIKKNFQCDNILWHWDYSLSKKQQNTLAWINMR